MGRVLACCGLRAGAAAHRARGGGSHAGIQRLRLRLRAAAPAVLWSAAAVAALAIPPSVGAWEPGVVLGQRLHLRLRQLPRRTDMRGREWG